MPNEPCTGCGARLATDQRYCLACGERRGALPVFVTAAAAEGVAPAPGPSRRAWPLPDPPAAAVALMLTLAFGVLVGAAVGPAEPTEASTPLLVAVAAAPTPVPTPTPAPAPEPSAAPSKPEPVAPAAEKPVVEQVAAAPVATPAPATAPTEPALPSIRHVFLIVLSGHGYDDAFGSDSTSEYLSKTLPAKGELLANYYAVAPSGLANGIALLSGQGPTQATAAGCPEYTDFTETTTGEDHQVLGDGCVYPTSTLTLADQLVSGGFSFKSYVEDIGNAAPGEPATCRHPAAGAADPAAHRVRATPT